MKCKVLYGGVGEVYNVGGHNEMKNIDIVNLICEELVRLGETKDVKRLITYVTDGKDHDMRYAIRFTMNLAGFRRPCL